MLMRPQNYKTIIDGKLSYFIQLVLSAAIGFAAGLFPLVLGLSLSAAAVFATSLAQLDNYAHVGGFVCGFLSGTAILYGEPFPLPSNAA